jgi:hypothetical protein
MTKKEINNPEEAAGNTFHKLSIQVGLDGLSFCVLDTLSNSLALSHSVRFKKDVSPFDLHRELRESLLEQGVLEYAFSDVVAIHRNALFTLVPQALFDPEHLANYLKFNARIEASDHLDYDRLEGLDLVNVYVPFANVNNYIYDLFGEFEFRHSGSVLLESLLKLPSSRQGTLCFAHLSGTQMDLAIFANRKLLFFNAFPFTEPAEVLYYLLFSLEQLGLDPAAVKVRLFGEVGEGDPVYEQCEEYLEQVSLLLPSDSAFLSASPPPGIDFTLISAL